MKVAVIQFEPVPFKKEDNLARLLDLCRSASAQGARLIVLPEMCTTGYCFADRTEIAPLVEPIPGPTTEMFGKIARQEKVYIVVGMGEVDPFTQVYYNSAVLIGPDGIVGRYRKTHSFIAETKWAKDGDMGIPVFDTEIGRIAMIICMDAVFFETARIPALEGADILAFPTNMFGRAPSNYWRARAFENGMYFLASNRWGSEHGFNFTGGSCVIGPDGSIINVASHKDRDEVVIADIDVMKTRLDKATGRLPNRLAARRPELYHQILINSYLWAPRQAFQLPEPAKSVVAAVQVRADLSPESCLREAVKIARESQENGKTPDLLVLPEMLTSGGKLDVGLAQRVPGPFTQFASNLAREEGCLFIFGLLEAADDGYYNTGVLVGPDGVLGKYRKTHLTPAEKDLLKPGDLGFPVFDTKIGRLGILMGSEVAFPETVRCLSKQAVDVLCVAASTEDDLRWLWFERTKTNSINLLVANYCGDSGNGFGGCSGAYGYLETEGEEVMVELGREGAGAAVITVDTDHRSFCRVKEFLRKLRPDLYDPIVIQRR